MTRRMVGGGAATRGPTCSGHCTGRLVKGGRGTRPQSEFDAEAVFAACAEHDVAVEINSRPERCDPPDELVGARAGGRLPVLDRQRRARPGTARLPGVRRRAGRAARRTAGPDRQHLAARAAAGRGRTGNLASHERTQPTPTTAEDAPVVEVRRSRKRRRTVAAYREDDKVVVLVPARFTRAEEQEWVATMLARLERSEKRRRPSDAGLAAPGGRAEREVPRRPGRAAARCAGSPTRTAAGAAARPSDRSIRLSTRLQGMPAWVIDYVLVHELAHLLEAGHTPAFWAWVDRYPKAERAKGFLEGVAAASQLGIEADPPDCSDEGAAQMAATTTERRLSPARPPASTSSRSSAVVGRQVVDRPPAHVERLLADRGHGARRAPAPGTVRRGGGPASCSPQNATTCASRCSGSGSRTRPGTPDSSTALAQRRRRPSVRSCGSQWPPRWNHRRAFACRVSSTWLRSAESTSAPGRDVGAGAGALGAVGVRLEVVDVLPAQPLLARVVGAPRPQRRERVVVQRGHGWAARAGVAVAGLAGLVVEQVGQRGVELVVGQRLGRRHRALAGSPAGRRGRPRWAAGRGATRPRRAPPGPCGSAASPTARRRRAAGAAAARGRPARRTWTRRDRPAARRRRTASCSLAALGIRVSVAWPTTSSTQPSTSASAVSSRVSAACCAGVFSGSNRPPSSASWMEAGLVGSMSRIDDSILRHVDGGAAAVVLDGGEQVPAQPRHVREQPLVGGLAQREVEEHVVLGRRRDRRRRRATFAGSSAAVPSGPRGRPMSEALSTSPASPPSAWPTWLPNIAPPAWPSRPISGPAICCASGGQRVAHRGHDVLGDRLDEHLPDVDGLLDPLGAAPGRGRA